MMLFGWVVGLSLGVIGFCIFVPSDVRQMSGRSPVFIALLALCIGAAAFGAAVLLQSQITSRKADREAALRAEIIGLEGRLNKLEQP